LEAHPGVRGSTRAHERKEVGATYSVAGIGRIHVHVPSRLEMGRLLLMEESKWERPRLEGANAAAEVLRVDESGGDRHSFHSIPIGDSRRIGFDVTDSGRWKCLVVEAWPPRELAEFALGWTLYLLHRLHRS